MMVFIFVVIGLIGLMILSEGVTTFARNENSPVLTEKARLIKKTGSTVVDANGAAATTLILQFEIDGTVLKCAVNGTVYRQTKEGMEGLLTHQGTRFKCFEVDGLRIV